MAALEVRVQAAEDRLAIYQLIATYGPAVDSLSEEALASLWAQNGAYETDDRHFRGLAEIGTLLDTDMHRDFIERGCAHVLSLPHITIHGDRVTATGHSRSTCDVTVSGAWSAPAPTVGSSSAKRADGGFQTSQPPALRHS